MQTRGSTGLINKWETIHLLPLSWCRINNYNNENVQKNVLFINRLFTFTFNFAPEARAGIKPTGIATIYDLEYRRIKTQWYIPTNTKMLGFSHWAQYNRFWKSIYRALQVINTDPFNLHWWSFLKIFLVLNHRICKKINHLPWH